MSNVGKEAKEVKEVGEKFREAILRAATSLELFVVAWKRMLKITGIREF